MSESKALSIEDLCGDETPQAPARRGPGRPRTTLAPTFEGALENLSPVESKFVRHVLTGATYAKAYGADHPNAGPGTSATKGLAIANRKHVAHALALGRKDGAVQALAGIRYDLQLAYDELCTRIDAAHKAGQHNAVASLMRLKMAAFKLIENKDTGNATAGAAFTLVLKGADGVEKVVSPAATEGAK